MISSLILVFATSQKADDVYPNYFERIGKSAAEVERRVKADYEQFFYGKTDERVFYPNGSDEAYILDVGNNDVRTEGMSYGMMLSVQLNRKSEFDRLWKFAKNHMQYKDGPMKSYFAWQCKPDGTIIGKTPASDGEEYFATSLLFAAARWGNKGVFNYQREADAILDAMLENPVPIFDRTAKMVNFVPSGDAAKFTDPSYHLPAFYEIWARRATKHRKEWKQIAAVSRQFLAKAGHPTTGLFPDYATFEGKPTVPPWDPKSTSNNFNFDAWRCAMNIAVDRQWFRSDPRQVELINRYLAFFSGQGIDKYASTFELNGKPTGNFHSEGLVGTNAIAATISSNKDAKEYIRALWNQPLPKGQWRYYNGMLHMFGMLNLSGNYRSYLPRG